MTTKLLANQLRSILNEPVEGFTVELADESDMFEWRVWIEGPRDTAYQNGVFQLSLKFPKDYPMSPPELKFVSEFWHPNVFPNGKVCLSILHPPGEDAMSGELPEERWLPTQSVTTIILSLLSVLNDPNCASPANVDASVEWRNSRDAYKARCRKLVDKAIRECPPHVVIPHPESDADQRRRRVEKFHEMNKDLDYEDFYENENENDAEEENESGDENEFLESENEDINTDDERSPPAQHREEATTGKSSEETELSGASESASKKEDEDSKHGEDREVKQQSKGKEKAPEDSSDEEFIASQTAPASSSSNATPPVQPLHQPSSTTATLTDSNISTNSNNNSSLASSSNSNNNADVPPPGGKKGKKGGKKAKKCTIM